MTKIGSGYENEREGLDGERIFEEFGSNWGISWGISNFVRFGESFATCKNLFNCGGAF